MITSEVRYLGNLRTEAKHVRSGDTFITDAPVDNNGKGEAFSPTDTLATSLATCAITTIGIQTDFDLTGSYATVVKHMRPEPRRVSKIVVEIFINNANLTQEEKNTLENIGLNCPVAKSLHPDLIQEVTFKYPG